VAAEKAEAAAVETAGNQKQKKLKKLSVN